MAACSACHRRPRTSGAGDGAGAGSKDFRLCLDDWPADGIVTIARGPVRAVASVTVYDGEGEPQAVDLAGHLLDGEARPARLWLRAVPEPGGR